MNDNRRKELNQVIDKINEATDQLKFLAEEERDYYYNAPENLQGSEKYERADEVADELEEIVSELDDITNRIEEAMQ